MGRKTQDLTGLIFGNLTVINRDHSYPSLTGQVVRWICTCTCGTEKSIVGINLTKNTTTHCGCLVVRGTHNKTRTPEWNTWVSMKNRMSPNYCQSEYYYDKGLTIDPRWVESFEVFLEEMGEKPFQKASIDRIDNSAGYWKENCRWADDVLQSTNRDVVSSFTYKGATKKLPDWAREYGISNTVLLKRIKLGWGFEKALLTPVEAQEAVLLTYNGETKSLVNWEKSAGFKNNVIGKRLALGWSVEDAITKPLHVNTNRVKERLFTIGNETKRLSEWARQYGLTSSAVNARLKKGMSIEEAITKPKPCLNIDKDKIKHYLDTTRLTSVKIAELCNCTYAQVKAVKKTLKIQRLSE